MLSYNISDLLLRFFLRKDVNTRAEPSHARVFEQHMLRKFFYLLYLVQNFRFTGDIIVAHVWQADRRPDKS